MAKPVRPWFKFDGRNGDRTLDQQMQGLRLLLDLVKGKTVLDVGCAEGLIDFELIKAGAAATHGIEIRPHAIEDAMKLRGPLACAFEVGDADEWQPKRSYDIVIMLALLHKLKDPSAACARYAECAKEMVVLRLPPRSDNPTVVDARSNHKTHNIGKVLRQAGFHQRHVTAGYLGEWVGYYTRPRHV
jgi:2-polyprenyl-3-methyl-5-hydroxy-6-metoxy-1,4-benzoquinol methylase